jgi:hypothetical protein
MKKKSFYKLWMVVQVLLFILPILISVGCTGYRISWDEHYVENVNQRALMDGYSINKATDFSDAQVARYDLSGHLEGKVWMLNNKEIYLFQQLGIGVLIGLLFQIGNMMWSLKAMDYDVDSYY